MPKIYELLVYAGSWEGESISLGLYSTLQAAESAKSAFLENSAGTVFDEKDVYIGDREIDAPPYHCYYAPSAQRSG